MASLFGVIVLILLCFVCSPYLEFERETVHYMIGQKAAYTSSMLQRR